MRQCVWVTFEEHGDVLGVHERLSDAERDCVPEDCEVVHATDRLMIYENRDSRIKIVNPAVVPLGEEMTEDFPTEPSDI